MGDYEDARIKKTRVKIFSALASLMQKQSFESISVAAICQQAHISRATFYHHYPTKEAVVDEYQNVTMTQVYRLITNSDHNLITYFERLTRYLDANAGLLGALLSDRGTLALQAKIREQMAQFFRINMLPQLEIGPSYDSLTAEYAGYFYANAIFGILQHWLQRQPRQSPDQVSKILATILPAKLAAN